MITITVLVIAASSSVARPTASGTVGSRNPAGSGRLRWTAGLSAIRR